MSFKKLIHPTQVSEIAQASNDRLQMIFKHSTRCSISAAAKHRLEIASADLMRDMDVYYLDLILYRDVSNEVASVLGVRHESPQVILVSGGKPVFNITHYDIEAPAILQKAEALRGNQGSQS